MQFICTHCHGYFFFYFNEETTTAKINDQQAVPYTFIEIGLCGPLIGKWWLRTYNYLHYSYKCVFTHPRISMHR